jgi:hypothetical protein
MPVRMRFCMFVYIYVCNVRVHVSLKHVSIFMPPRVRTRCLTREFQPMYACRFHVVYVSAPSPHSASLLSKTFTPLTIHTYIHTRHTQTRTCIPGLPGTSSSPRTSCTARPQTARGLQALQVLQGPVQVLRALMQGEPPEEALQLQGLQGLQGRRQRVF